MGSASRRPVADLRVPSAYGITATPDGTVSYVSPAGSHLARINSETGEATVVEPPTPNQGARLSPG